MINSEEAMTKQEKRGLARTNGLVAAFRHTIQQHGPNATIALVTPGKGNSSQIHRFIPTDKKSPCGSIVDESNGTLTVIYHARELLDYFTSIFPTI